MKKNYIFKTILFAIPLTAFILVSFSGGVNGARTGSPGDGGNTCTACHAPGASFGASGTITTNIPVDGYALGQTYQVTVSVTSSTSKHGFQATAENTSNAKVGAFAAADGSTTPQDSNTRISHSASGNTIDSWTFDWTAPSTNEGDITFYAAINAVNDDGGTAGDQVITISSASSPVLSISDAKRLNFDMYPNPSNNFVNVQLPSGVEEAKVSIFDYTGREVIKQEVTSLNKEIGIQDLATGIYIMKVEADNKIGTQQLVKE